MSASLARTLFRPTAATTATPKPAQARVCPASRFFPTHNTARSSRSARTVNAVAHISVAAALVASTVRPSHSRRRKEARAELGRVNRLPSSPTPTHSSSTTLPDPPSAGSQRDTLHFETTPLPPPQSRPGRFPRFLHSLSIVLFVPPGLVVPPAASPVHPPLVLLSSFLALASRLIVLLHPVAVARVVRSRTLTLRAGREPVDSERRGWRSGREASHVKHRADKVHQHGAAVSDTCRS
ncbi:hypothetical protein AAT19DRAFT_13322 [Rhodotorula toruloides]|uniref:Uncharacterized protein n=1 Tax=Rhodotorula toruloides TaxID=5286 RepID=A0A2T0AE75_RHOTO|nr:hypothetical protein AAT19DRAFT_13322 [Rhodotorula toruloides]